MNRTGPKAEIFSQGEEVITGQTVDTNAAWIAEQLVPMGFDVTRHTAVGDRLDDLVEALVEIEARADCCICSGGLGPTRDDLTAEAVSTAFRRALMLDAAALDRIERYFDRLGRHMPAVNRKQALLPEGATRLDNDWGTAPGFALQAGRCWFAFLPGVPSEMRRMFAARVKPELERRFRVLAWRQVTLCTVGIGESAIEERLEGIAIPEGVELGFRAGVDDIQTKLLFPPDFPEPALDRLVREIGDAIGDPVFAIDGPGAGGGSLAAVIGRALAARGHTVALAETVSGGKAAHQCASQPGFLESLVVSDVGRLLERFGIAHPRRQEGDAYAEAAGRLAEALRRRAGAHYGLAQLWRVSGPAEGGETVLALYNALAAPDGVFNRGGSVRGDGARRQNLAATGLLDLLRRYLQARL